MALWFRLMANDEPIGVFYAQRQERLSDLGADRVATYDVEIVADRGTWRRQTMVRHCYDDGAWALVEKAIAALREEPT
jgi:hypothetical protein